MNIYANRILKAPRVFLLATDDVTSESSQPFEFSQSSGSSPYEIETKRKLPIQLQFNNSNDITASNSTRAQGVYQCHSRSIARLRHSSPAKEGNSLSSINHSGRHKSDPSPIFHSPSPLGIYRSGRKRRIIENDEAIWNSQFGNTPIIASAKSLKSISSRLSSVSEDLKLADFCCACLQEDSSDDDPIILCDGRCGQSVHLSCFGLKEVPTGKFYCDGCSYDNLRSEYVIQRSRCYLCNRSEGFLCKIIEHKNNPKLKPSDQFVHLICVLFINELTLDPDSLKPNNLLHLDKERKDLFCNMCKRKGLGVAQCTYGNCMQSSHPYCCFSFPSCSTLAEDEEKRWSLVILEKSNNADFESSIRYELYCPRHVNKIPNDCIVSFQGRLPEKNTFQSIDETASNCVSKKIVSFQQDSNDNEDLSNVKYSKRYVFHVPVVSIMLFFCDYYLDLERLVHLLLLINI